MHDVIKTALVVLHVLGSVELGAVLVVADLRFRHRRLSAAWYVGNAACLHLPSPYGLLSHYGR